jgi:hypothetical protein
MAEFDEKLNSLLSDPNAMAQIMQLAQSLSGNGQENTPAQPSTLQQPTPPPATEQPEPGRQPKPEPEPAHQPSNTSLSALTGGMDPKLMTKLLPLVQELGGQQDSNARQLLYALRPYLKPERQEKVERALQLARLFHIGKKFLSEWGS